MLDTRKKHSLSLTALTLVLAAIAIALLTQTGTGTLPIYAPALVLANATPLTFGSWTTLFGISFLLVKLLFKTKTSARSLLIEISATIILGLLIDSCSFLFRGLSNASFAAQIACLLLACFLLAVVSLLQQERRLFVLPGDALSDAIRQRSFYQLPFQLQLLDILCLLLGILLAFIFFQQFYGLGMATYVPPFLVPYFGYWLNRGFLKLEDIEFF